VIESWGLGYHLGNVVKYIARHERKGAPLEDLEKAAEYLRRYIAMTYPDASDDCESPEAEPCDDDDEQPSVQPIRLTSHPAGYRPICRARGCKLKALALDADGLCGRHRSMANSDVAFETRRSGGHPTKQDR
jgi:hypothetical protein